MKKQDVPRPQAGHLRLDFRRRRNNLKTIVPEPAPENLDESESLHREKARLKKIGVIILLLGLVSAGLLYWIRARPEDPALENYRQNVARAETRQMESLYGTSGDVMQKLLTALKRPGTQAIIIVAVTVLVSGACFYLSRPFPENPAHK